MKTEEKSRIQQFVKCFLTRIGARLPANQLAQAQGAVNYLNIGKWFQEQNLYFPRRVRKREDVWRSAVPQLENRRVLYLEFGVARGESIRWWSRHLKHPDAILHGFDSFEGLPESGSQWRQGQFSTNGCEPVVEDSRVRFFKGWFNQTLPNYGMPEHEALFVNMDADLYSSTIYVLRWLRPFLKPGTLIYFDEMNQLEHEPKAFDEFVKESRLLFEPVCADMTLSFVLVKMLGVYANPPDSQR